MRILGFVLSYTILIGAGTFPAVAAEARHLEASSSTSSNWQRVVREAYLMGTHTRLVGDYPNREVGLEHLEGVLSRLEAAERELSTWRSDSLLSHLNRHPVGRVFSLSPLLCSLFGDLFSWTSLTDSAFDPAIGHLIKAWDLRGDGRIPLDSELRAALGNAGLLNGFRFQPSECVITRLRPVLIDAGAFGKGAGLDQAGEWSRQQGYSNLLIDLGGQITAAGSPHGGDFWTVRIAHPSQRDRFVMELRLGQGSLATSGGSERNRLRDGQHIAHILDPRTGFGATFEGSVVVWHPSALAADVVSTALFVMGPEEGLRWAERRRIAACFLIPDSENPHRPPRKITSTAFDTAFE